ncbi:MAG: PAS domain-containing sensor histidine kinase [Anaerolineaceae bacterium]|nr:MAG: PAS domain-containing sensor histidine kinase [Anaerolineaceae bacterium]
MPDLTLEESTIKKLQARAETQGVSADQLLGELLDDETIQDMRQFFSLSIDMLCVASADGHILRLNDAFATTLGYQREDLIGRHLLEFIHPDDIPGTLHAMERHVAGEIVETFENRYRCADESFRWLAWSLSPTTDGKTYAIARDISERVQNDMELRARNEELDAFAYSVAHDVKNPIASMMGFASLMRSYYERMDRETMLYYTNEILEGGYQVREIVDSLLLLARVRQANMPKIQPVDMMHIIEDVTDRLKPQIMARSVAINMPESWPKVLGYAPWIEQVWMNYISNAIKYGGTPPVIELGADNLPDGRVRFWVRDNGGGLTSEEQKRLFKPFTRLSSTRKVEGHGLGLSIVNRIVDKLGGQVGVESVVGEGSRFYFTLYSVGAMLSVS